MLKVLLFRTPGIEDLLLYSCIDVLSTVFDDVVVEIAAMEIDIPKHLYDSRRRQYHADGVVYFVSKFLEKNAYGILLANVDGYVPGLNFVFGLAIPSLKCAVVFTERLKIQTDFRNYVYRIQKEVVHEFGHLLGLDHCTTSSCVMRFSNTVFEVDAKGVNFCRRCRAKLLKNGIRVREL